ncbi:hypothetical protein D5086_022925 [Populus alba]|uniref:Uncharacterized protein n=1 Tax=Populus alba TaxID=43335 RepID=A0ACC4B9W9_POPAL
MAGVAGGGVASLPAGVHAKKSSFQMTRSELPLIWKNDGMPPDYARIHSLIPVKPFKMDIVAKVDDPADIPSVFRRMITKASKAQVEEREAKGEMTQSSSPIQGDLRWEMPQKLGKVKNRPEILFSYTLGGHISLLFSTRFLEPRELVLFGQFPFDTRENKTSVLVFRDMENISGLGKEDDDKMDLPPGFRFHPTDEELISHYLYKKVLDINFSARAIGDVDLNKSEPWELPWKAKMGEKEWVFQKSSAGKKNYISGLVRLGSFGNEFSPYGLPPLTDSSPSNGKIKQVAELAYVPCFSNLSDDQRNQQDTTDSFNNHLFAVSSNPAEVFPRIPLLNSFYSPQAVAASGNLQYPGSVSIQDHSVVKALIENQGSNMKQQSSKLERDMASVSQDSATDMNTEISSVISNLEVGKRSFDEQEAPPSTLVQSMDLDCFWNY